MRKGLVTIREEKCKECSYCIITCPRDLLEPGKHLNKKGYHPVAFNDADGRCNACELCGIVCPDRVIDVYHEKN